MYTEKHVILDLAGVPNGKWLDIGELIPRVHYVKDHVHFDKHGVKKFLTSLKAYNPHHETRVFVDCKILETPTQAYNRIRAIAEHGVDAISIHLSGGERMINAALRAVRDAATGTRIWGVTTLSSTPDLPLHTVEVRARATAAWEWGIHAVIAPGFFVDELVNLHPRIVATGIRSNGVPPGDHGWPMEPAKAISSGATYIVIGGEVTGDPDPAAALDRIEHQLAEAPTAPAA